MLYPLSYEGRDLPGPVSEGPAVAVVSGSWIPAVSSWCGRRRPPHR